MTVETAGTGCSVCCLSVGVGRVTEAKNVIFFGEKILGRKQIGGDHLLLGPACMNAHPWQGNGPNDMTRFGTCMLKPELAIFMFQYAWSSFYPSMYLIAYWYIA